MQTPLGARPHRPALESCSFKLAGRLLEFVSNYEPRWMVISLAIARQDPAYRATLLYKFLKPNQRNSGSYFIERFAPTYQVTPATTCIDAKANAVFESSEALNGAAAVTIPNTRPIIGDFVRKPCDLIPMREVMKAATTSPNKEETKTKGKAISCVRP